MAMVGNTQFHSWGLWLFLGILLILLGLFLLATPVLTSFATVFVFGLLLIAGGIVHAITSLVDKNISHRWLHLVVSALTLVVGVLVFFHPGVSLAALTLLLAAFFFSNGIFRIIGSLTLRFNGWGWYLVNGIISVILGVLILLQWPSASLWVIGLLIGIDFLFAGLSLVMISMFMRKGTVFA